MRLHITELSASGRREQGAMWKWAEKFQPWLQCQLEQFNSARLSNNAQPYWPRPAPQGENGTKKSHRQPKTPVLHFFNLVNSYIAAAVAPVCEKEVESLREKIPKNGEKMQPLQELLSVKNGNIQVHK